jgi:ribosomal-protein-alanine N-acetyltransferase
LTVEPLTRELLNQVAALEEQAGDVHWTHAQFEREITLPMSRFFVLCREGNILGYGGFWKVGDEAQITNLAVHPDERHKGHGRRLVDYLLTQAKQEGCCKATLEVRGANQAAQGLYRQAGFIAQGRRARAYSTPSDDAILMEKLL